MALDPYVRLAEDYAWLFDDDDLRIGTRTPGALVALRSIEPGARVLDAACGIGTDAAALARLGCDVAIADASAAMLSIAADRLAGVGATFRAVRGGWEELPEHFLPGTFDAVVCTGNSISHLPNEDGMIAAFCAFAALLAPDGLLVLDTHDWDQIRAAGSHRVVDPQVITRDGRQCIRSYAWYVPDEPATPIMLELEFAFVHDATTATRTHRLDMYPFSRSELRSRLARAGFDRIALDAIPGHDRYTATARRSRTPVDAAGLAVCGNASQ